MPKVEDNLMQIEWLTFTMQTVFISGTVERDKTYDFNRSELCFKN